MPAIPYTKSVTTDAAWDGPANKTRLSNVEADLRGAFAWVDDIEDATTKAAYRFIHHFVNDDGSVGAASTVACTSGIGVLNGGRSGTTIPDADREGVYRHLAHHLEDAGQTAPELKPRSVVVRPQRGEFTAAVRRTLTGTNLEVRAKADGSPVITGYAAVFDRPSSVITEWGSTFVERIKPGAFTKTLTENNDVLGLFNHDMNFLLGRGKNGTLRLSQDNHGLRYEIDPPPTPWAQGLVDQIGRGDFDGASFQFRAIRDDWGETKGPDGKPINERTLYEVQLFDVGPATLGAYPDATTALRSLLRESGIDPDLLLTLGEHLKEFRFLVDQLQGLRHYLPTESTADRSAPVRTDHPPTPRPTAEPSDSAHSAVKLQDRLTRLQSDIARDRLDALQRA